MELSECQATRMSGSLSKQSRGNPEGSTQPLGRAVTLPCSRHSTLATNCPNEDDAFCPQSSNSVKGERGSVEVSLSLIMPSIWPSGLLVFIDVNRLVDSFSVSLSFSDLGRRRSKREIDRRGTWKSICCIRTNVYSSIRREERSHAVATFLALFAGSRYLDVRTLGKDGRSRPR